MDFDAAATKLSGVLGKHFTRSKGELDGHSVSETHFPPTPPDGVAYPGDIEELAKIVKICAHHGVPLIGWGAGTSLEGHALAVRGGLTVDFSRMNRILAVNSEDMNVVVEPGITREDLNAQLRDTGLFFPVDPGANASIGGMAATRASGTTTVRYGTMADNVIGTKTVLASGEIIKTGGQARKSSAGYDLTSLLVGSEGTLGLMGEITLRLHGQPEAISAAVCAFEDIEAAVDCVIETIQTGIPMARIEFVDQGTVAAFNQVNNAQMPLKPHLMVEFHGSPNGTREDAARFGDIAKEYGASDFDWANHPEDRNRLWKMRHGAYPAILQTRPNSTAVVTDICVPISRLAQAVRETQNDIAASPIDGPILGHVGDGNFHAILLVDRENPREMDAAQSLAKAMATRALALGGTITGEHGVGIGKLSHMDAEHGPAWDTMAAIKRALDPENIMNPGKLLRQN